MPYKPPWDPFRGRVGHVAQKMYCGLLYIICYSLLHKLRPGLQELRPSLQKPWPSIYAAGISEILRERVSFCLSRMDLELLVAAAEAHEAPTTSGPEPRRRSRHAMAEEQWAIIQRMTISRQTSEKIVQALQIRGHTARRYRAIAATGLQFTRATRGRPPKNDLQVVARARDLLASDNCLALHAIQEALPEHAARPPSTICRILRSIGITRKRAKPIVMARNEPRVIKNRLAYSVVISS